MVFGAVASVFDILSLREGDRHRHYFFLELYLTEQDYISAINAGSQSILHMSFDRFTGIQYFPVLADISCQAVVSYV